ncbi:MAG TPA: L-histidine N(alpha)-methyltransferase [Chryseosolibacter sp.]
MVIQTQHIPEAEVIEAVAQGLSAERKSLPSWMLYDETGDKLFQEIMRLPEYYPTRCEFEILNTHKEDLARYFNEGRTPFTLIELGAGDGTKTDLLLDALMQLNALFTYSPVDISKHVLDELATRMSTRHVGLDIRPLHASYDEALSLLPPSRKKVLLFLGANIGNMTIAEAQQFLKATSARMSRRDVLLIGFDLKKDPRVIHRAYDDSSGVTRNFNLNVLTRLNHTVAAEFDVAQFNHYAVYNPETGTAASYLVSLKDQDVAIKALGKTIHFSQWETIHTEISQKYDLLMIEKMLTSVGLEITDLFFDKDHYFCDVVAIKQ